MQTETLITIVLAQINGQNGSDDPLTDRERAVIDLAVRATVALLRKGGTPHEPEPGAD